jgi:hypothetical protein
MPVRSKQQVSCWQPWLWAKPAEQHIHAQHSSGNIAQNGDGGRNRKVWCSHNACPVAFCNTANPANPKPMAEKTSHASTKPGMQP